MSNSSADLYTAPVQDLSQGDIIQLSPHLYLDPPLLRLVRSEGGSIETHQVAVADLSGKTEVVAMCNPCQALVINYDCEIAKETTLRLLVCPIVPLSSFPKADQGNVKRNRTASLFFLPRYHGAIEDGAAVLNQLTTIHRLLLSDLNRVATLTPTGRLAFYAQFVRWLTRWELRKIPCPNCRIEFDPTLSLPVRSANDP